MKKFLALVLAFVLVVAAFAGCGAQPAADAEKPATDEKIVLKWAELNPADHPMGQGASEFKRLVEEKTNGRITVDLHFSGTLGDEKTSMQACQIGTVDIFRGNATTMSDYGAPLFNAIALPYVFTGIEHQEKVLRSEIADQLLDSVQASGTKMVGLAFFEEGPRNLFFTKKAVTHLEDLKGLKIRVPETELMMNTFKALGSNPTPISYSELYTSLQTNVVDGAENGVTGYVSNSFFEVAPYYVKDAHTFGAGVVLISENTWNKLSAEDQALLKECAREAQDFVLNITKEVEGQYYDQLAEKNVEVLEVEDLPAWSNAVADLYAQYDQDVQDLIAQIREMA